MNKAIAVQNQQETGIAKTTSRQLVLTRIQNTAHTLTSEQISIVKAYQAGLKVKEASKTQLGSLWNRIIFYLGIRITQAEEKAFWEEIDIMNQYLLKEFPERTLEEIDLAYNMLIKGELGIEAYPLINPNQFGRVMSKFIDRTKDSYNEALDKMAYVVTDPNPEPSDEKKEELFQLFYQRALKAARNHEFYEDYGSYLFDELEARGLIDFTEKEETEIFKQAAEALLKEKYKIKEASFGLRRMEIEKEAKAIANRDESSKIWILIRAKRIALDWYLAKVIENE